MSLTESFYRAELTRISDQLKSVREALNELNLQEELSKLFLELSETRTPVWIREGPLKLAIQASSGFFRITPADKIILTVYRHREHYWVDSESLTQGRVSFDSNELKSRLVDAPWTPEGSIERTDMTIDRWLVQSAWSFSEFEPEPVISLENQGMIELITKAPIVLPKPNGNVVNIMKLIPNINTRPQPIAPPSVQSNPITILTPSAILTPVNGAVPSLSLASSVAPSSNSMSRQDFLKSMSQSFLNANSPSAGMGQMQRETLSPVVLNPGLTGDINSSEMLRAVAKAHNRLTDSTAKSNDSSDNPSSLT